MNMDNNIGMQLGEKVACIYELVARRKDSNSNRDCMNSLTNNGIIY